MGDLFDTDSTEKPVDQDDGLTLTPTHQNMKPALQELLKFGLLEENRKINLYRGARGNEAAINAALEPLDLKMVVDDARGIVFLKVRNSIIDQSDSADQKDDWSHPLVRRQRLTAEQSLVIAILRQMYLAHEQESGIGEGTASATVDELTSSLQLYLGTSGSETKDTKRTTSLLEALRTHNIVSDIDEFDRLTIRPLITQVADPESLRDLLQFYKVMTAGDKTTGAEK